MRKNRIWIVLIFICSLVILWPLLKPGFFLTDDGDWMIIRLSAFYQSLREGQFPVRFLGRLNNSYGYPVANFLYPGFLYIGAVLRFLGFSFIQAVEVIFGGSIIVGAFSLFFWLRKFTSPWASFVGSLSFLFGPYLLFDLYKRGSVGEVLCLGIAAFCLLNLENKRYAFFAPAFSLLLLSHNSLSLLFAGIFLCLWILQKDIRGVVSWFIGVGMATFFWFPAIYERMFVIFDQVVVSNPQEYFLRGNNLILIGIPSILSTLYLVFFDKFKQSKRFYLFLVVVSVLLSLPVTGFLWNGGVLAKLFQFPYRFLSIGLLFGSYAVAMVIDTLPQKARRIIFPIFILLWLIPIFQSLKAIDYVNFPIGYYATNEATTTVANEYMPKWVKEVPTERTFTRMVFIRGRGRVESKIANTQKINATVYALEDSILQINSIYYPGWGVTVNDIPVDVTYENTNGLIRFPIPQGTYHVMAEFRETVPRFIANIVSLVFVCLYGVITFQTPIHSRIIQLRGPMEEKKQKKHSI